jgi:hypothetical protein
MAQEFAKAFYNSKAWKECREGFIQSVFGLCKNFNKCHRHGIIVHHTERLTRENINDPYITLNWDKLEYLCIECHRKKIILMDKTKINRNLPFTFAGLEDINMLISENVLPKEIADEIGKYNIKLL